MPDRHTTYRITLTPATEAALLRLKECGENKQLLSRCALWCSSGALEAIIVLQKKRYPYQVRRDAQPLHATPLAAVLFPAPVGIPR